MITKNLKDLIKSLPDHVSFGDTAAKITSITDDSRNVQKGSLFVAISGKNIDAHEFIDQAISNGAVAVVGEKQITNPGVAYIKVADSRKALSYLASAWNNNPSKKLKLIGVTGTDGKTTTANIIYEILRGAGKKVGLISTVSAKIEGKDYDTGFHVTNPEPLALYKFLALMVEKGCEYTVLEVTSHGIDQERIAGLKFEISVLTNITHEHLDYHKTYENYLEVKARLFQLSKVSVLNKADSSYLKVRNLVKGKVLDYTVQDLSGEIKDAVWKKFPENYNRSNAAGAVTVAQELGIDEKAIVQSIKSFKGIVGRMEEIKNKKGMRIIVDFAHTPNALENVLRTLKDQSKNNGKLIAVFGCASERDDKKRPLMGEIATRIADVSIFTAEDPRKEDISKILYEMASGSNGAFEVDQDHYINTYQYSNKKVYFKIPERGEAISFAINKIAKKGDTVVITGKGHEKSMSYNGVEYPWSDQEAVGMALLGKVKQIIRK